MAYYGSLEAAPVPPEGYAYNATLDASDYTTAADIDLTRACRFIEIKPLPGCSNLHLEFNGDDAEAADWTIVDSDHELIRVDGAGTETVSILADGSSGSFSLRAW